MMMNTNLLNSNDLSGGPTLHFDTIIPSANPLQSSSITPLSEERLTPEERLAVDNLVSQINLANSELIGQYGINAQIKVAEFSDSALRKVQSKDFGEVGDMLNHLVVELNGFDADEKKGFLGLFKKGKDRVSIMKNRYKSAESNINQITTSLQKHYCQLFEDVQMLDRLYLVNQSYYQELSLYILAGQKKLSLAQSELPALIEKSAQSELQEDAQAVKDFSDQLNRFEKKIHDLELTRTIALQMAPQIRMVQNNDLLMAEKIQSSIVNTIPLWKSQMVLSLGLLHSGQAAKAQQRITDTTNALLRKNADTLKLESIAIATESERGIVDVDTLRYANTSLIETFNEVIQIQAAGSQKRRAVEEEIRRLENDLRTKLVDVYQRAGQQSVQMALNRQSFEPGKNYFGVGITDPVGYN